MKGQWLWLLAALALLPVMISTESLWIDEAQTAGYAAEPTLADLGSRLLTDHKSEAMMPLPMSLAWVWVQVIGSSELALRFPNLLYLAIAFAAIWRIGCRARFPALVLFFACHPFVWYYANEARPYALQIALSALLLAASFDVIEKESFAWKTLGVFLLSAWLLSATSLLAVFPVLILFAAIGYLAMRGRWTIGKGGWPVVGLGLLAFIPLGIFYLWAFQKGASGARLWSVGIKNLVFALYEMVGAQGLGPGRTEMREAANSSQGLLQCFIPHLPLLGAYGLCLVAWAWAWLAHRERFEGALKRFVGVSTGLFLATMLMILALALTVKFPFWGRHLSPVFPAFVLLVVLNRPAATHRRLAFWLPCFLLLMWLTSALEIRFADRFAKDDYREAARLAREALSKDQPVWWVADREAALYYQLPADSGATSGFQQWISPAEDEVSGATAPDWVFLSKPDVYDRMGTLRAYLKQGQYRQVKQLSAFTVWQRPEEAARL